ncbi:MAG: tRNA (adenosine(37)-N6)-threonylcarbamoyltransferase complex ATPase subunit type 1 TsaE [Bacteroidia bacterium]|nr:tRNA (adenosine(37)-N6)-threonylcarbamoyltransferase complex ATPase subunit type 1 TsaE [Bacteroidia bacterium]MDW8302896.1 tRNA (adenosine(37)-N6)-threonylcarbamoyltransferase complex ATPase subunit type 1 TsaE [Bacteroidia bacterium]
MQQTFIVSKIEDLEPVAQKLTEYFGQFEVYALEGEMGSGKTTFMRVLGKVLNVNEEVNSPTYSLVNEYTIDNSIMRIFHFDLFRLNRIEELIEIGFEEYLHAPNVYVFIEWWQMAKPLLEKVDYVHLMFEKIDENTRKISINEVYAS